MTLAEARADIGSRLRDFDDEDGGGGRGRRLSLARVTAATILAEARADVGFTRLRDGNNDAGRGARGRRLSLACVKARTTMSWQHCRPALMMAFACLIDGNDAGKVEDSV